MFLMRADPLRGQVGRGWAWKSRFFGSLKWLRPKRVPCGRKKRFPGPNPLPLAQVMDLPASKTLRTGPYHLKSENSQDYAQKPQRNCTMYIHEFGFSTHRVEFQIIGQGPLTTLAVSLWV
jgi:hypothetical protein